MRVKRWETQDAVRNLFEMPHGVVYEMIGQSVNPQVAVTFIPMNRTERDNLFGPRAEVIDGDPRFG